ncbi:MAG: S9 family peptidase [Candidatus Delongbacteria bacterium]|nr:S9 family peptidase [Candidatus Delongbacteria bacterium]
MKHLFLIALISFSITCFGQKDYKYPHTLTQEISDTIWGRIVYDPYRWLEDIKSNETQEWIKLQDKVKNKCYGITYYPLIKYLSFYSHIDYKPIFREGKYYFMYRYEENNQTPSLYFQKNEDKGPKFLFNPNLLDKNASVAIDEISISSDNKTLALVLSKNSGDWKTIRFLDIEHKKLLTDTINFVKYSPIYWSDNGVLYIKYDVNSISESFSGIIKGRALYFHKIGTSQNNDLLIYKPESEFSDFSFEVTPKKQYLVIYHSVKNNEKRVNKVSLLNLPLNTDKLFQDLIISTNNNVYFNVIGEFSDKLLVYTNLNAENGAIYNFNPNKTNSGDIFVPQYKEQLEYAKIIGDKLVKIYNDTQQSYAVLCDSTGKDLNAWEIPEGYTFSRFSGSISDSIAIYYFNSFFSPASIYKINLNTFERTQLSKTYIWFNNKNLTTEKVYYYSKDSTKIPMYITYRKDIKLNGNNPTILYGYGGFGISMEPFFSVPNIIFLNNGGVLAAPCLRGGGDFPGWHEKGMRLNKQNTFDDFISAAQYLIDKNYTNSNKLAAMGGSNGGLVVGTCMTQRPDLFKVVISKSGVLDMLRYHLYNIGYNYLEEYGNITDSLDFENLIKYSPVNNVKKGVEYPATLLVASDNDDRVLPFESFKFLSELQAKGGGENPYVLYYQEKSGHSGSDVFEKRIETDAFIYSFIFKYLGIEKKIKYDEN